VSTENKAFKIAKADLLLKNAEAYGPKFAER
jgi:hypothetical protein